MTSEKVSKKVLRRMEKQRRGDLWPAFRYIARLDPDFLAGYNEATIQVFNYGGVAAKRALGAKTKELIAIALLASVRGNTTANHIKKAYQLGATRRQVLEALEVAYQITGAPSLEFGVQCMIELEEGQGVGGRSNED